MPIDGAYIPGCPECDCDMQKVFSIPNLHLWGDGYYHYGIGEHVTSNLDLKKKMDKKAEEVSARTGVDTEYSLP